MFNNVGGGLLLDKQSSTISMKFLIIARWLNATRNADVIFPVEAGIAESWIHGEFIERERVALKKLD